MRTDVTETQTQITTTLGERIADALVENQMSQSDLAREMGVSASTISQWCNDKRSPRPNHQKMLCQILHMSPYQFEGAEIPDMDLNLSNREKELLALDRDLDDMQHETIVKIMKVVIKSWRKEH